MSPCNEYSGLISFTIDWFDLLAVQGTLKSLLQHHSLKGSEYETGEDRLTGEKHTDLFVLHDSGAFIRK